MKINYLKGNETKEIDVRCSRKNIYFNLVDLAKCLDLNDIDENEAVRRLCKILGEDISNIASYNDCYTTFAELKELKQSQNLKNVCKEESFDKLFEFICAVLDGIKTKKDSSEKERLKQEFNYHLQESKKHMDIALGIQRKLLGIDTEK